MPIIILTAAILLIWLSVHRMRSLSTKTYGAWRKVIERVVLSMAVLLAIVTAGNTSFNAIALHRFWALHPAPGMIVDVDGRKMHIDCTGSGSPTIVLEAGGENDSLIWRGVQPALSRTTRVCAYDRAGLGWSDVLPGPRDADHIAAELHQLLQQTGITGPVILMGHSIGGIFLRDYVTHYPTNVAGIVFIDSSTPFQDKNPAMKLAGSGPPLWIFNLAMIVGVPRLIGMCGGMQDVGDHEETAGGSDLPPALQRICRVGQLRPFQPADAAFRALRRTTDSHHLA
jgi:pimeloyl-ACP methyl ester carboxylesterase